MIGAVPLMLGVRVNTVAGLTSGASGAVLSMVSSSAALRADTLPA